MSSNWTQRVIRRDLPRLAKSPPNPASCSWIGYKIEKAVDAACAAIGQEPIGKQIQG